MKELEINKRVQKKIDDSSLDPAMKDLLKSLLNIELNEGKAGTRYSGLYEQKIEGTYIMMKRRESHDQDS